MRISASWSLEKRRHNRESLPECVYIVEVYLTRCCRLFMSGKLKVKGDVMKGKSTRCASQQVDADHISSHENGAHTCKGADQGQVVRYTD